MKMAIQARAAKTPHLSFLLRTHLRSYIPAVSEKIIRDRCLSGKINLEEALFYLDSLSETRPFPCIWTFDYLFASISRMGHHFAVISHFRILSRIAHFKPQLGTLNVVLRCYCVLGRPDLGLGVIGAMLKLGLGPDSRSIAAVIRSLFAGGEADSALQVFALAEEVRLCDEFVYGVVIDGLCKAGDGVAAMAILRRIRCPDAGCFGPIIDALCRAGDSDGALALVEEMAVRGVSLNEVISTSLVHWLCRLGRWSEARAFLCGEEAYNAAVDSFLKSGRWREAVSAFEAMLGEQVRPSIVTFTSLLCGLSRSGRCDEAMRILGTMEGFGVRPNVAVFAAMSRALCREGRIAEALGLLEQMAGLGVEANVLVYNHLIHGCFRTGKWREGSEIVARMKAKGVQPNVVTFTVLAGALHERRRTKEAVLLFKDMIVKGLVPDRAAQAVLRKVLTDRPGRPRGQCAVSHRRKMRVSTVYYGRGGALGW